MRIISGKFKGKTILFLKSKNTRPLKDSVKENIFNIIGHSNLFDIEIENSKVFDIYSGIGSFGLECLSRGAKQVFFIEKDELILKILTKNVKNLSLEQNVEIINDKIMNFLKKKFDAKFDIFFLDPPFADNSFLQNLRYIRQKKIFKKNHIIILHREKNSKDDLSGIINTLLIKIYGRSKIIFAKFL